MIVWRAVEYTDKTSSADQEQLRGYVRIGRIYRCAICSSFYGDDSYHGATQDLSKHELLGDRVEEDYNT